MQIIFPQKESLPFYTEFVALDLETTGLNPMTDQIIEIGAVKFKQGQAIDQFSSLVNPRIDIPEMVISLTGITNEAVKNAPFIETILPDFLEFIKGWPLIAHNSDFDLSFLRNNASKFNKTVTNPVVDTLRLARKLFPNLKNHKLNTITKYLQIELDNPHRALWDSLAAAQIYLKCIKGETQTQLLLFE